MDDTDGAIATEDNDAADERPLDMCFSVGLSRVVCGSTGIAAGTGVASTEIGVGTFARPLARNAAACGRGTDAESIADAAAETAEASASARPSCATASRKVDPVSSIERIKRKSSLHS